MSPAGAAYIPAGLNFIFWTYPGLHDIGPGWYRDGLSGLNVVSFGITQKKKI